MSVSYWKTMQRKIAVENSGSVTRRTMGQTGKHWFAQEMKQLSELLGKKCQCAFSTSNTSSSNTSTSSTSTSSSSTSSSNTSTKCFIRSIAFRHVYSVFIRMFLRQRVLGSSLNNSFIHTTKTSCFLRLGGGMLSLFTYSNRLLAYNPIKMQTIKKAKGSKTANKLT